MVQATIATKEIHKAINLKKKNQYQSAKILIQFRYMNQHIKKQYLNSTSFLKKRQSLLPCIRSETGYFQIVPIAYLDNFFHALI